MANKYLVLLTDLGQQKLIAAQANNTTLQITQLAVGDGGGNVPIPTGLEEKLINQKWIGNVGSVYVSKDNPHWLVFEADVPNDIGDFWIREVGVFDSAGDLVGYGNYPETYKPVIADGASKEVYIQFIIEVSSDPNIVFQINNSTVYVTQQELTNHNNDANAHPPITQYIDQTKATLQGEINTSNAILNTVVQQLNGHSVGNDANDALLLDSKGKIPQENLSPATTTTLGDIIVGNGLSITSDGVLSANIPEPEKIGMIKFWFGTTPPDGYLEFAGQTLSKSSVYGQLFTAGQIQNIVGSKGSGSLIEDWGGDIFSLKDMRGYFPRILNQSASGVDPNRKPGSLQADAFKSHNHKGSSSRNLLYSSGGGRPNDAPGSNDYNLSSSQQWTTSMTGDTETRPINTSLMLVIKAADTSYDVKVDNANASTLQGMSVADILALAQGSGGGSLPIGTIISYSSIITPKGFMICDGSTVSRTTYASLFSVYGTTFGAGDGSTTFNLPDLRGEFIRGFDDGRGVDTGRVLGSEQLDSLQSFNLSDAANDSAGSTTTSFYQAQTNEEYSIGSKPNPNDSVIVRNIAGASGYTPVVPVNARVSSETRPRNVALVYLIKVNNDDTTMVLRNYIDGLILSNNTDVHTINIAEGSSTDSLNTVYLNNTKSFSKNIIHTWSAGSGNGGSGLTKGAGSVTASNSTTITGNGTNFKSVFSVGDIIVPTGVGGGRKVVAIASDTSLTVDNPVTCSGVTYFNQPTFYDKTWYHVFIIMDSSDNIDFGFDTNINAINLLNVSGYKYFRRIGSIGTDSSGNITPFIQLGDTFYLNIPVEDVSVATPSSGTRKLYTLTVPTGTSVEAMVHVGLGTNNGAASIGGRQGYVTSPLQPDVTSGLRDVSCGANGYFIYLTDCWKSVTVNTSGQIGFVVDDSSGISFTINTFGWIDKRGKQ